ncbi:cuticle protein 19.8-like [Lepeophtheirus salmonis]|uniref:cuticle protein 19.8-like n=1 Tax=Lepeophtheirus salmonis TaxID=72036 RepID=UPI001AE6DF96|nr:pro-resilin-like [Lepeophtheirus salmonis]
MFAKILIACLAINIALVASVPSYTSYAPTPPSPPPPPPPASYGYNYAVADNESGVSVSADEQADNGAVAGSYRVTLPDGRIKVVTYTVEGDSGFIADVQYEEAPASASAPAPKYAPYKA